MEEHNTGPTADEVYEDITKFDNIMFIVNPIRAMKFAELLSYISEFSGLRVKLMRASKSNSFSKIADDFNLANSEDYKILGKSNLPKSINTFLDELEGDKEINFTKNDIEEVEEVLKSIFLISDKKTLNTSLGIKNRLLKLVS